MGPILVRLLLLLVLGVPAGYFAITLFHDFDNERVVSAPAELAIVIPQSDRRGPDTVIAPVGVEEAEPRRVRTTTVSTDANEPEKPATPPAPAAVELKVPEAAYAETDRHSDLEPRDGVSRKEGLLGAVAEVSAVVPNADPVYLMALADKEFELRARRPRAGIFSRGPLPIHRSHLARDCQARRRALRARA